MDGARYGSGSQWALALLVGWRENGMKRGERRPRKKCQSFPLDGVPWTIALSIVMELISFRFGIPFFDSVAAAADYPIIATIRLRSLHSYSVQIQCRTHKHSEEEEDNNTATTTKTVQCLESHARAQELSRN